MGVGFVDSEGERDFFTVQNAICACQSSYRMGTRFVWFFASVCEKQTVNFYFACDHGIIIINKKKNGFLNS